MKRGSWEEWIGGHDGSPKANWSKIFIRALIVLGVLAAVGALIFGFINID